MPELHVQGNTVTKIGIWTGDVIEYQGQRYKIEKINPANYRIIDTNGGSFNLARSARGIIKSENQEWDGPKVKTDYEKYLDLHEAGITLGTAVRLSKASLAAKYGALNVFIVIALPNNGTMRLAKLGGQGGKYLRNITASDVEVVNVDSAALL